MEAIVIDKPADIEMFHLLAMRQALELEINGMKRKGKLVLSQVKKKFGFKGDALWVYIQFYEYIETRKKQLIAEAQGK